LALSPPHTHEVVQENGTKNKHSIWRVKLNSPNRFIPHA
jgi:hypothetical protein